jgi:hypothetical protein
MAKKQNGVILYRGPSMLDGAPIVAILTGLASSSLNPKTGDMLQTWIIREDVSPVDATRTGDDASVCGDCKHRPANMGSCYVTVFQAPRSVHAAYHRGVYGADPVDVERLPLIGEGRNVRIGSYGDPAAVPAHVWAQLVTRAASHTGYSHQWHNTALDADQLAGIRAVCMASVDSEDEAQRARAIGWRTFRVRGSADEPMLPRESVCPASHEAGQKLTCQTCNACEGSGTGRKGSIVIVVHGSKASRFAQV